MIRTRLIAMCVIGVLATSACDRKATGQVAAVVDGEEITLQEINAELAAAQIPQGADKKAIQNAALQRIVERRLMADVAKDDGLDKQPEFLLRRRQLEDLLLVQMLGQKAGRSLRVPSDAALDAYIAQHPTQFANREVLALDQIQFPMPADPAKLKALEADHSMDAVATRLKQLGIQFQRGNGRLDTLQVPPETLKSIEALPAGEPFVLPANGSVSVSVITGRTPSPVAGPQARPIAVQMMRNEALGKALQQRLVAKKASAKITYQPGFEPPKASDAKPGAPKPPAT